MNNPPDSKLGIHRLALLLLKWICAAERPVESVDGERVDVGASGSSAPIMSENLSPMEKSA